MLFNVTEQEFIVAEPEQEPSEPEHFSPKVNNNYRINCLLLESKL
ncbi:hypothetical protein [Pontibacter populi]|uniref:Uncharacterized protein n=1 Tax=Pontibacter populi TaxID=890055 RepID=A0ABV1RZC9_9BACT